MWYVCSLGNGNNVSLKLFVDGDYFLNEDEAISELERKSEKGGGET
jgi:hypothetical protein